MSINAIESEMKNSLETLLKPIVHATETKHSKLFVSSLSIVKKFVTYNMIKQNHTGQIIQIYFGDANTTLVNSANFILTGSANVTPTANSIITMTKINNNQWVEVSRSIK